MSLKPAALALPLLALLLGAGAVQVGGPGAAPGAVTAPGRGGAGPQLPARLTQTGLYQAGDLSRIAPALQSFSPQYPLWSDGATKTRWILIPRGQKIDARDTDAWAFPVGTKLWKEFTFQGRKVETRFIWHPNASTWVFASYAWREDQSDADLVPEAGKPAAAELAPGKWHDIPSVTDCRACHVNGGPPVLGFTALQLSTDRDPNAPHAEPLQPGMLTLASLDAKGLLAPPRPDLVASPPRIPADKPLTRAALGYFTTNCGTCHRATAQGSTLGAVDLAFNHLAAAASPRDEPGWATTVGRVGKYTLPGEAPGGTRRVVPGDPERSALLYRMASRRPASQMPPLGSVLADEAALALMRKWIAEETR